MSQTRVVYTGTQDEFSIYLGEKQHTFKPKHPVAVDAADAKTLLKRGDFEAVTTEEKKV